MRQRIGLGILVVLSMMLASTQTPLAEPAATSPLSPEPGWWRQSVSVTGMGNQVQELCFANLKLNVPMIPPGGSGPVERYCREYSFSASEGAIRGKYVCRLNAGNPADSIVSLEQTGSYTRQRVEMNVTWSQSTLSGGTPSNTRAVFQRLRSCTPAEMSTAIGR